MVEYPSIANSSKAPRKPCLAFAKKDGSNIRVKFTQRRGFCLFGSREQLIDEKHPHLGQVVPLFMDGGIRQKLEPYLKREYPNEREIIVFGEFFGPNSFAGLHVPEDPKQFVLFDVLLCRHRHFVTPREFVRRFAPLVPTPEVVYEGNLSDQFIADVRTGAYPVDEGVVCKGVETSGAYRGHVWMAKIKTLAYLQKLKNRFRQDWERYWE